MLDRRVQSTSPEGRVPARVSVPAVRSAPSSGPVERTRARSTPAWGLTLCLAAVLAQPGLAGSIAVEGQSEVAGHRFCLVRYRTSAPCPTRVRLADRQGDCLLASPGAAPSRQHELLVPLSAGEPLRYSIVLPDGSSTAPRVLPGALADRPRIRLRQEESPDGRLSLLAATDVDAHWSLELGGQADQRTRDGGPGRSPSVRFELGRLDAGGELGPATVTARYVDGTASYAAGPVLGSRKLAETVLEATSQVRWDSILARAAETGPARLIAWQHLLQQGRPAGLEKLVEPARSRAWTLLGSPALRDPHLGLVLSWTVGRIAELQDRAASGPIQRGQPGLDFGSLAYPEGPPETSHSLFSREKMLKILRMWPPGVGSRILDCTHALLSEEKAARRLDTELLDRLPGMVVLVGAGKFYLAHEPEIPEDWLRSPSGELGLYLSIGDLEPGEAIHLLVNDAAVLTFWNRPEAYRGPAFQNVDAGQMRAKDFVTNWICCRVPARLFRPGKNSLVLTAEALHPNHRIQGWTLPTDLRLSPL